MRRTLKTEREPRAVKPLSKLQRKRLKKEGRTDVSKVQVRRFFSGLSGDGKPLYPIDRPKTWHKNLRNLNTDESTENRTPPRKYGDDVYTSYNRRKKRLPKKEPDEVEELKRTAQKHRRFHAQHLETGLYDVWDPDDAPFGEPDEELDKDLVTYYKRETRQINPKPPKHVSNPVSSSIEHVTMPHPGASYNPTFEDHQELLSEAHAVEEAKLQHARDVSLSLNQWRVPRSELATKKTEFRELMQGLVSDEDEDAQECEPENPAPVSCGRLTKSLRKLPKIQRRKIWRRKVLGAIKSEQVKLAKDDQILRIDEILEEIKEDEVKQKLRRIKRTVRRKAKNRLHSRPGRKLCYGPSVEVKLSSELTSSLRLLTTEGSLARDKYKNLKKRTFNVPRTSRKKKRTGAKKKIVRPRYKLVRKRKRV